MADKGKIQGTVDENKTTKSAHTNLTRGVNLAILKCGTHPLKLFKATCLYK